jgi:hypothetical protein
MNHVRIPLFILAAIALSCGGQAQPSTDSLGADAAADAAGSAGAAGGSGAAGTSGAAGSGPCAGVDLATDPHNCGSCAHDCQGGACEGAMCQPVVLFEDSAGFESLALDDAHLYWLRWGGYGEPDNVMKLPKAGGTPQTIYEDKLGVASLTTYGDTIYLLLAEYVGAMLNGGAPTLTKIPYGFSGGWFPFVQGQHIYYLGNTHNLARVELEYGTVFELTQVDSELGVWRYAVDDSYAYYIVYDGGTLFRISLQGGTPEQLMSAASWSLALRGNLLFFSSDKGVGCLPKTGGAPQVLAEVSAPATTGMGVELGVDDTNVYWTRGPTQSLPNELLRTPLSGGPSTVVATVSTQYGIRTLLQDSTSLYFTADTRLMKLAK